MMPATGSYHAATAIGLSIYVPVLRSYRLKDTIEQESRGG
jgi:hypothetical protein